MKHTMQCPTIRDSSSHRGPTSCDALPAPLYHLPDRLLLRAHPRGHFPQLAIRSDDPDGIHLLDDRLIRDIVDHQISHGEQGVFSYHFWEC